MSGKPVLRSTMIDMITELGIASGRLGGLAEILRGASVNAQEAGATIEAEEISDDAATIEAVSQMMRNGAEALAGLNELTR